MTREEAIKVIENIKEIPHIDNMVNRNTDDALSVAINALKSEPKHGRWVSCQGLAEVGECQCSVCKVVFYADDLYNVGETDENGVGQALLPNYCPHCGARMDEVENG